MSNTVIVTGAARGIGLAIAERFLAGDWRVVLADISPEVVDTAKALADTGASAVGVIADIGSPAGVQALVEAVPDGLDSLINNAGITRDAMLHKMTEEQFVAAQRVNLGGPIRLIEGLLPHLKDGSAIVNVSSKSASGNVGQFNYAMSKAGMLGLTRSLARTLAPKVRVNAISPGFIATEMTDAIPEPQKSSILAKIPYGRAGQPSEIAGVAYWLSSQESSFVIGQVIAVCGGRTFAP